MEQRMYMTTGELAKLMGITKETLFHYDEIELFCPAVVLPNGYRYYEVSQMELLDSILLLKELGMPLKEIRELLRNRSPEKILNVFTEREQKIQEEMEKLRNMKRWIAHRKKKIKTGIQINPDEIRFQKFPACYYLYSRVETEKAEDSYKKASALVTSFLEANPGFKSDYEVAYIQHGSNIERGVYDCYDNVVILLEHRPDALSYRVFPEGTYLIAYHKGHWRTIGIAYQRILAYIHEHNLQVEGEYMERALIDTLTADDPDSYMTEISVRIREDSL